MRRRTLTPRDDWQSRVEKIGVTYHTLADGTPYWDESATGSFQHARSIAWKQRRTRFSVLLWRQAT